MILDLNQISINKTSRKVSISKFWLRWREVTGLTWWQLVLHRMWRPVTLPADDLIIYQSLNVCSLLHKSLACNRSCSVSSWLSSRLSSSCLAHSQLGSCLLNKKWVCALLKSAWCALQTSLMPLIADVTPAGHRTLDAGCSLCRGLPIPRHMDPAVPRNKTSIPGQYS